MVDSQTTGQAVDTKEERFHRLAEQRVNATLDKLRLLGQLSNRRNYKYEQEQIDVIFKAINKEVRLTKARFGADDSSSNKFKL